MDSDVFVPVLRAHLSAVMGEDEFDLAVDGDGPSLDISTDHWTIHLESGAGFMAIDDEPDDPARFATSRRSVMSEKVERVLALADRELGGAISTALTASGDPFTLDFVAALAQHATAAADQHNSTHHEAAAE